MSHLSALCSGCCPRICLESGYLFGYCLLDKRLSANTQPRSTALRSVPPLSQRALELHQGTVAVTRRTDNAFLFETDEALWAKPNDTVPRDGLQDRGWPLAAVARQDWLGSDAPRGGDTRVARSSVVTVAAAPAPAPVGDQRQATLSPAIARDVQHDGGDARFVDCKSGLSPRCLGPSTEKNLERNPRPVLIHHVLEELDEGAERRESRVRVHGIFHEGPPAYILADAARRQELEHQPRVVGLSGPEVHPQGRAVLPIVAGRLAEERFRPGQPAMRGFVTTIIGHP